MIIREIPYDSALYGQCKKLRQDVLRTPIGKILSEKDVAGEEHQIHIAAMEGDEVVGCIILKTISADTIKFRQVAVSEKLHAKGVGRQLMQFAETLAKQRNFKDVEISARMTVQVFYEKLGYAVTGDPFTEVDLYTIKMVKDL